MKKTFNLYMTFDTEAETLCVSTEIEGCNAFEMMGMLEAKRYDLMRQLYNPNEFTRIRRCENGESEEIIYKEDEDK